MATAVPMHDQLLTQSCTPPPRAVCRRSSGETFRTLLLSAPHQRPHCPPCIPGSQLLWCGVPEAACVTNPCLGVTRRPSTSTRLARPPCAMGQPLLEGGCSQAGLGWPSARKGRRERVGKQEQQEAQALSCLPTRSLRPFRALGQPSPAWLHPPSLHVLSEEPVLVLAGGVRLHFPLQPAGPPLDAHFEPPSSPVRGDAGLLRSRASRGAPVPV